MPWRSGSHQGRERDCKGTVVPCDWVQQPNNCEITIRAVFLALRLILVLPYLCGTRWLSEAQKKQSVCAKSLSTTEPSGFGWNVTKAPREEPFQGLAVDMDSG